MGWGRKLGRGFRLPWIDWRRLRYEALGGERDGRDEKGEELNMGWMQGMGWKGGKGLPLFLNNSRALKVACL